MRNWVVILRALVAPVVLLCVWSGGAMAAQAQAPSVTAFVRPSIGAARINASEAPAIDGDLSDAVWAKAAIIDKFTQKQPNPGAEPTERTVVRIMYDENNIYFGVYNYDSQPDAILARTLERDGPQYTADSIVIQLDPGQTRRNAYSFEVGASGGRVDELELNNTVELTEWDTIWTARARRVSDGWVAEVSIPFRSFSFENSQTNWGFDFSRRIRHKNERIYWSGFSPTLAFTDVSQNGNLTGISNINQGFGLDIQLYGALRGKHDWRVPGDGAGTTFTAGGNAFYKITPALTNTLTVNPDFSDAPLDVRQVNTTRFSLFTPETRDFFLQDVSAFEFGGRNFGRNFNDRSSNNGRPFFSRNIGLAGGTPVSLVVGDKVSGQFGGFDVGALSVLTDKTPTSDGQVLSVARVTHPIFAESKFGFMFTNGDPTGLTENTVAGVDLQFRDSDFLGGKILQSDLYYQKSFSSKAGNDHSAAIAIIYPNEPWGGDFVFKEIGKNFLPALGFINRTGIRQYLANVSHLTRYRNMFLNQFEYGTDHEFVTDLHNRLESRANSIFVRAAATQGDEITVKLINSFENVPLQFNLPGAVAIRRGRYDWTNINARLRTFDGRTVSGEAEITCCSFYNGDAVIAKLRVAYRPNAYFSFIPAYEGDFIRLPTGNVTIHILSGDAVINFLPDMQLALQAQFDNISHGFGFSARYRWEYEPGNELFLAIGQSALIPDYRFQTGTTQVSLRLGHTFRF